MRTAKLPNGGALLASLALVLVLAGAAFYIGRTYSSSSGARAAEPFSPEIVPDTSVTYWYVPWFDWEATQTKTDKMIAGVAVGPATIQTGIPCTSPEASLVLAEEAQGSRVDFSPSYLPDGTTINSEEATKCRGEVIALYREYRLPLAEASSDVSFFDRAHGGYVEVYRAVGDPAFSSSIPDYRWEETEINGSPAALAHPLIDAGFGSSMVLFHDGEVLTVVRASGLSLDELIRVSEGLR